LLLRWNSELGERARVNVSESGAMLAHCRMRPKNEHLFEASRIGGTSAHQSRTAPCEIREARAKKVGGTVDRDVVEEGLSHSLE